MGRVRQEHSGVDQSKKKKKTPVPRPDHIATTRQHCEREGVADGCDAPGSAIEFHQTLANRDRRRVDLDDRLRSRVDLDDRLRSRVVDLVGFRRP